ncbi:MAG TPA: 5-formyltetrahydrofolate cyclo-ligase [Chthoniobacterales bacterium]
MANKQTTVTKQAVRRAAVAMLNQMTPAERTERSQHICRDLLPWLEDTRTVALFAPRRNEPNLRYLGELTSYPDRVFLFPRIDGSDLVFVQAHCWSELLPGRFGIDAPVGPAWPHPPDVVVVPGLAFDLTGHRVGWGAGYYDRYLARLPRDTRTIGVGFGPQLVDRLPHEPHDVVLRQILTDEEYIGLARK